MFSLISGIQFATPLGLLALGAVPLLVLAYLRRKVLAKRVVSSVLILSSLSRKRVLKSGFKPPWRFYLELACLLLLAVAAAGPQLLEQKENIAVVIDTSLSMRAVSGQGSISETRLTEARNALSNWLQNKKEKADYTLFTSSPRLKQIGKAAASDAELERMLKEVTASFSSDSLDASVSELLQRGEYSQVLTVTDRPVLYQTAESHDIGSGKMSEAEVITVGQRLANAYLADIRLIPPDISSGREKASVLLGFSGTGEVDASVEFSRLRGSSSEVTSSGPQRTSTIRLIAGKLSEVVFELPESKTEEQNYRFNIVRVGSGGAQKDALLEDNVGYLSVEHSGGAKVLLVTSRDTSDALGLERISALEVHSLKPQGYSVLEESELAQYALIIFDQCAAERIPKRPTLLIIPPSENSLFPAGGEFSGGKVSSWLPEHPITSYLRFDLLKPERGIIFAVPSWAQGVINVEKGALVTAGESQGIRFAGVGIEILPFGGAETPAVSILTLNIFNWLMGSVEFSDTLLTGASISLDGAKRWMIQEPDGHSRQEEVKKGEKLDYILEKAGMYIFSASTLKNPMFPMEQQSVEKPRKITVNSFFPGESATAAPASLIIPRRLAVDRQQSKSPEPLWPILAAIVMLLLLFDILAPAEKKVLAQK